MPKIENNKLLTQPAKSRLAGEYLHIYTYISKTQKYIHTILPLHKPLRGSKRTSYAERKLSTYIYITVQQNYTTTLSSNPSALRVQTPNEMAPDLHLSRFPRNDQSYLFKTKTAPQNSTNPFPPSSSIHNFKLQLFIFNLTQASHKQE